MTSGKWASEAAMMTCFQAEARAAGFGVYPESCGVDLVLEATEAAMAWMSTGGNPDPGVPVGSRPSWYYMGGHPFRRLAEIVEVGDLIGIEGKLRPSIEVLAQAMPPRRRPDEWETGESRSFDFYGVVVPGAGPEFHAVARAVGVLVFSVEPERPEGKGWRAERTLPAGLTSISASAALRVDGFRRHTLPRVQVDMAAGQSAPRRVTPWKLDAVELCLIASARPLTRADFKTRQCQPSSLVRGGWFRCKGRGPSAQWHLVDGSEELVSVYGRRPDLAYPEIVKALLLAGFEPSGKAPSVDVGPLFSGAV